MPIDPTTGLVTVFENVDERTTDRELKRLDLRLFLAREFDPHSRSYFYEVRHWEGSEREPTLILDWREPNGRPKPLSSGIVCEVQRMMARGPLDVAGIARRNEELKQARDRRSEAWYRESVEDFERVAVLGNRTLMPRSSNVAANARRQRLRDFERKMGLR